jgi:hypothetical protein
MTSNFAIGASGYHNPNLDERKAPGAIFAMHRMRERPGVRQPSGAFGRGESPQYKK